MRKQARVETGKSNKHITVRVSFSCIVLVYLVVYFCVVLLFTPHDLFTLLFTVHVYLFIYHCSPRSSPTHDMFCAIVCYSVCVFANLLIIVCTIIHLRSPSFIVLSFPHSYLLSLLVLRVLIGSF